MDPKKSSLAFVITFVVGSFIALALQVYFFSPLSSPQPLHLPPQSISNSIPPNKRLQEVTKIGEGLLNGPEDVSVDKEGILYTASRNGWITKVHKNGSLENWKWLNSSTLLGLTITEAGDLIVCDAEEGLLMVNEDGVTTLVSHYNGSKLSRLVDDVIEAKDGSLYFSAASSKYGLHEWHLDLLEARPHGQLLKYNPQTKETSLLLDSLFFANGVALSTDQDYLVVCETFKFRCLKYWLQGDLKGKTETLVDNLPGGPDNINLAPDGSFWVAVLHITSEGLEFVHTSPIIKHFVATFPKTLNVILGVRKRALVVKVAKDGKILKRFDDPEGKVMSFVTSAVEYEGHLYLGNLNTNFIGKLSLYNTS